LLIDATHGGREKGVWRRIWAWNERKDRIGSRWAESRRALVSDGVRELRITEGAGGGHFGAFTLCRTYIRTRSQPAIFDTAVSRFCVDYADVCVCVAQQLSRTPRFDNIREMPPSFVDATSNRTRHALW